MMDPILSIVFAWAAFGGTHIGMASRAVREPLANRLGATGFAAVFSIVASITFAWLCYVYASVQMEGPSGLALGDTWLGWPLIVVTVAGVVSIFGSLLDYPNSAYMLSSPGRKPEPRGFDRITRHGFAFGVAMVAAAHTLLATRLTGTVFFALLAVFAILGSIHQDAKLRARNPSLHGPYMEKSSLIPFGAIIAGRNRLVVSELRPLAFVLGLLAAWGLREVHPWIFARGGMYVVAVAVGGAAIVAIQDALLVRRKRSRRENEWEADRVSAPR